MIPNIHPQTLIPYGVISGRLVPDLVERILERGHSVPVLALQDALQESLLSVIKDYATRTEAQRLSEDYADHVMSELDLEFEEEEFVMEGDDFHFHLGYLGGAILIWVKKSPYVTFAPVCSPCVRNAGDLDNANANASVTCYSLAPQDYPDELRERMVIYRQSDVIGADACYKVVHPPQDDS